MGSYFSYSFPFIQFLVHIFAIMSLTNPFCRLTLDQVTTFKQNFLRARGQFFQKKFDLLSSYDQGEFLRGYISLFKEKLTTMISQYQAVFGNMIDGMNINFNFILNIIIL